ncbi:MAG: hypothetical protein GXP18_10980 [Gammaproteobacteria bacterium]|nr:hypothetical protein [Gammaproteobacteria bacterium]
MNQVIAIGIFTVLPCQVGRQQPVTGKFALARKLQTGRFCFAINVAGGVSGTCVNVIKLTNNGIAQVALNSGMEIILARLDASPT